MRITFQEVSVTGKKSVKCACGCGKRITRQKKFYQTLNPFNKNSDGSVKTREQIWKELSRECELWRVTVEYVGGHEP